MYCCKDEYDDDFSSSNGPKLSQWSLTSILLTDKHLGKQDVEWMVLGFDNSIPHCDQWWWLRMVCHVDCSDKSRNIVWAHYLLTWHHNQSMNSYLLTHPFSIEPNIVDALRRESRYGIDIDIFLSILKTTRPYMVNVMWFSIRGGNTLQLAKYLEVASLIFCLSESTQTSLLIPTC